jgi:hypothetical protein
MDIVKIVDNHECRIRDLEISEATTTEKINTLCKNISDLTNSLRTWSIIIVTTMFGIIGYLLTQLLF